MKISIGTFIIKDKVVISDPCYSLDTRVMIRDLPAMEGVWEGKIDLKETIAYGYRVNFLYAFHKDFPFALTDPEWLLLNKTISVDSGQAGIFNQADYPESDIGTFGDQSTFYGKACSLTYDIKNRKKKAGILYFPTNCGIVCDAGLGDGEYDVWGIFQDKKIVAIKIDFHLED
jgi:hypothetical protein